MEEELTRVIISINDEDYPFLLTESQDRLLTFLMNNHLTIEVLFSVDNEDFHTI